MLIKKKRNVGGTPTSVVQFSKIIFTYFTVYVGNHVYNLAICVDSQSK